MFEQYYLNNENAANRFGDVYPENASELIDEYNTILAQLLEDVTEDWEAADCADSAWERVCNG